jgi:hypothetical protein
MEKFRGREIYPGWALKAEQSIVERSARQLMEVIEWKKWKSVLLTRPGCYNGGLDWDVVAPMLELILDHRVFIVYNDDEV